MTIINWTYELSYFPFRALSEELVRRLRETATAVENRESTLKLFDCYCDLANLSLETARSFRRAVLGFAGAMSGTDLVDAGKDTRNKYARFMVDAYNQAFLLRPDYRHIQWSPDLPLQHAEQWQSLTPPPHKLRYWRSWSVTTRSGNRKYLPLPSLFLSHGEDFTEKLHKAIEHFFAKQSKPIQTPFNMLINYLVEHKEKWPKETFNDPDRIEVFFEEFMIHFFTRAESLRRDIQSHSKLWNTFTKNVYECFVDPGIWARPFCALPRVPGHETRTSESHIKIGKNGELVKTKLITEVPLSLTDKEAIQILFKDIKRDVELIKNWATAQTSRIIAAMHRRNKLAETGNVISTNVGAKSLKEIGEENICATFASHGYIFERKYLDEHFGTGVLRDDVASLLAIPTKDNVFPFQCLLTAHHQQITPSLLETLTLYNKNEKMTGFVKTDTGYQLVGLKARKGKLKALQKIDLSPETATLVKDFIDLTEPLRRYLKSQNDDSWRFLFISAKGSLGRPTRSKIISWNTTRLMSNQTGSMLKSEFAPFTDLQGDDLLTFLKRVSLTTIRTSCAVAEYLEHNNLSLLVKALGHEKYDKNLLRSYLPQAVWDFFQTRWARVFQCAYICEAMKDSRHLLRASGFSSINELHEFLGTHALKEVPESLSDPEMKNKHQKSSSKIYIAVNEEILVTLISLQQSVCNAEHPDNVNAQARYWAKLGQLAVDKIEEGNDFSLKQHLIAAKNNLNTSGMENLIYELP